MSSTGVGRGDSREYGTRFMRGILLSHQLLDGLHSCSDYEDTAKRCQQMVFGQKSSVLCALFDDSTDFGRGRKGTEEKRGVDGVQEGEGEIGTATGEEEDNA